MCGLVSRIGEDPNPADVNTWRHDFVHLVAAIPPIRPVQRLEDAQTLTAQREDFHLGIALDLGHDQVYGRPIVDHVAGSPSITRSAVPGFDSA